MICLVDQLRVVKIDTLNFIHFSNLEKIWIKLQFMKFHFFIAAFFQWKLDMMEYYFDNKNSCVIAIQTIIQSLSLNNIRRN